MNSASDPHFPPLLKVTELSKTYVRVSAVTSISFEVFPGEIVGILGPNGAGKTTTIECILNLRSPDSGNIEVNGIEVGANHIQAKQLIGAQLQSTQLPDAISPLQALKLAASFYSSSVNCAELLEQFDLGPKANSPFRTLSEGQKQKLSLALALVHQPKLLLLDEPTAGLDPNTRSALHKILLELRARGCAILLSTHLLHEAEKLCDRILFIDQGKLIAQGTASEIIAKTSQLSTISLQLGSSSVPFHYESISGISSDEWRGNTLTIQTENPDAVLIALFEKLVIQKIAVEKLEVVKPDLESAYLTLTGQVWPEGKEAPN